MKKMITVNEVAKLAGKSVRTLHYYDCTLEIFKGLGQLYVADERFTKNIDKTIVSKCWNFLVK